MFVCLYLRIDLHIYAEEHARNAGNCVWINSKVSDSFPIATGVHLVCISAPIYSSTSLTTLFTTASLVFGSGTTT